MKKCPFCDWENEDNASKCLACGCALSETKNDCKVDPLSNDIDDSGENSEYSVVITYPGLMPGQIGSFLAKEGLINFSTSNQFVKDMKIDKLSKLQAKELAAKLRAMGACVKVMKTELVTPDFVKAKQENFKNKNFWTIKLLGGQQEREVQEFIADYFGLDFSMAKTRIDTAVSKYKGMIISTDDKEEAEEIVSKLRELGAEAEIVEEKKSSAYLPGLAKQQAGGIVGLVLIAVLIVGMIVLFINTL